MTIIKFEIDTDDMGIDYEGYGDNFEDLFNKGLKDEISKLAFDKLQNENVGKFADTVKDIVNGSVEERIINLLNEDIVISSSWGEKKFVGSVEDYIKKAIDDKYMHPVNSSGKRLEGCTVGQEENTWINWKLKNDMEHTFKRSLENAEGKIDRMIVSTIKTRLDEYSDELIEKKVREKLLDVGLKL